MTGFARESAETDIGTLTWEIRAVNHRYLDVQFRLPEDLRPKEQALRQQASAVLGRGKVECALFFRRAFNQENELRVDTDLVELIGHRISDLTAKLPNVAAVNPIEILRWLLAETYEPERLASTSFLASGPLVLEVGPRMNFTTAWSTNAVSICHACGIDAVTRIERSRRYLLQAKAAAEA